MEYETEVQAPVSSPCASSPRSLLLLYLMETKIITYYFKTKLNMLLFFKDFVLFMCVHVFMCIHSYLQCPQRPKEDVRSPRAEITGSYEPLCPTTGRCWEPSFSALKRQLVPFTPTVSTDPSHILTLTVFSVSMCYFLSVSSYIRTG